MARIVEVTDVEVTIKVSGKVRVWSENYGEDADGNRGERRENAEIDDFPALILREINRPDNLSVIEEALTEAAINQED